MDPNQSLDINQGEMINEDKSLMVINENIRENVDFFSMEEI